MIIHSICPLCSSVKISFFLRCTDNLLRKEEFDLYKCSECRFVFTHQYPDEKDIGRYYDSDNYVSHNDQAKGFVNHVYLQARSLMLNKKKRIIEKATGSIKGRILDIGCGTGHFAAVMKKSGWDVYGIEPDIKARHFATSRFGLTVTGPEQILSLPTGSFDCITLWHVLEHFHDPFFYMTEIKRLLKPGGICLSALPNCGSFDAKHYGTNWAAYDLPRHLWHFTPETFSIFTKKAGFRITGIRPLPLDVYYISILSEKNKGSHYPFVIGMITGYLFAFGSLFRKNKSSSLIYFLH